MVFVTVGTHEQQFNRLLRAVDELASDELLGERVFVQTGYSDYRPKHCEWSRFVEPTRMAELIRKADVVVTHGGPSSFVGAMAAGKTPVVVPRRADMGEHVNNHQEEFVRFVTERTQSIIPVYDIAEIGKAIAQSRRLSRTFQYQSHNGAFCDGLTQLIENL